MDRQDIFASLRLQLAGHRISSIGKRRFVPPSLLSRIFTIEIIGQAVTELRCADEERVGLVRAIQERGITTFAILIWMSVQDAIVDFRRAGCLDSRLPIDIALASRVAPMIAMQFCDEYQWQFLPHFFSRSDDDVDIDPCAIVPIIREVGPKVQGGFGSVSKIEIHPSLHNFELSVRSGGFFIRKKLHEGGSDQQRRRLYRSEKRTLRLLNCLKHPNIIPLLYAYTHGTEYNLLFPCVETDLSSFLGTDTRLGKFRWDFTFFSALYGLASALSNVHQPELQASLENPEFHGLGYHHDLRPANVLVSNETFILADFGMSQLKPMDENSNTVWKAGAGDYLAPECMDKEMNHQQIGRGIDVWAMGCLMAEIATYMSKGPEGVTQFRQARLTPATFANWETSHFHDSEGKIKDAVQQWLELLDHGTTTMSLQPLCRTVLKLLTPPESRPSLPSLCSELAFLNIEAHFSAVSTAFTEVLETTKLRISLGGVSMKIWFERERFTAFGGVLSRRSSADTESLPLSVEAKTTPIVEVCVQLFEQLQACLSAASITSSKASDELGSSSEIQGKVASLDGDKPAEFVQTLEFNVQNLVQRLWDILPKAQLRQAEMIWVDLMLQTHDIERLSTLSHTLRSQPQVVYQKGAAMATMKRIRLEIISALGSERELQGLQLASQDVIEIIESNGHQVGMHKGTPVVLEWMYYGPSWYRIPVRERTLVMTLKAQGFNVPKSESLRLLHCIGFFEGADGPHPGYGFVYQIPKVGNQPPNKVETLLHLLLRSKNARTDIHLHQPLLGDKFALAYMLTTFLYDFHSIGWLHENFHSQNIVFFGEVPDSDGISSHSSHVLTRPYVLGLHKSRPGGDAWHTDEPGLTDEYLDYQHPDYATTRRFRYGYDYYSLGLMLLEVGLWTPLKAWSDDRRYRSMKPHRFRELLVQTYVPRLGPRMGKQYQDIVRVLLTDVLDPRPKALDVTEKDEQLVFGRFFEEVVSPMLDLSEIHL